MVVAKYIGILKRNLLDTTIVDHEMLLRVYEKLLMISNTNTQGFNPGLSSFTEAEEQTEISSEFQSLGSVTKRNRI